MKKLDFSAVFKEYYPLVRAYCLSRFGIDGYGNLLQDVSQGCYSVHRN